ncbi:MAG: vanadium-dependent haloperoxidase, partial [Acidobacteriota bacterium]|nr:vanadium-dependent haloperoxidase [Acidobacteriota bacterium]
ATAEARKTGTVTHTTNGDETLADKSATYTKCLNQTGFGIVDPAAFALFEAALSSGVPTDFEKPGLLGGTRKLNGPLGAFALTLNGADSQCFGDAVVPKPPKVNSPEYATELVELYWASLLRDVPFTEYETNATAIAAANELTQLKAHYAGPLKGGKVTPHLLFRGGFNDPTKHFAGQNFGPYISQFCIYPTSLGAQKIDQLMVTYAPGVDYLTVLSEWQNVQNGISTMTTKAPIPLDPMRRYLYNGRALGAFTHVDELYQAYFTAYLVFNTLGIGPNKTSPYINFKQQQPFGTFGGPDIAATLAAVAREAINAVWYQKWLVHLRHRPESGGGLVHLKKTGMGATDAQVDPIVLNSVALQLSNLRYGSYLLSQAFPEGSPAHPAYPTGHGTVGGACITVLKFFFDGGASMPIPPLVPSADGLMLEPYNGADAGKMTVNGELHKLAHNISFGHGIHSGIHWRSDTDYSILLGEAVALRFLQDQAYTYQENIDIKLTKLDGTQTTVSNH